MALAFMLVDRLYEILNGAISVGSAIGIAHGLSFLGRLDLCYLLPTMAEGLRPLVVELWPGVGRYLQDIQS